MCVIFGLMGLLVGCATLRPSAKKQEEVGVVEDYYVVTGTSFDPFFKSSAETYVSLRAARILLNRVPSEIKRMAISHVAASTVAESLKEAPTEECIKVLKEKKGELRSEEIQCLGQASIDLIQAAQNLQNAVKAAVQLIPQGKDALQNAPTQLTGTGALKLPKVTKGIKKSLEQLNDVKDDGPLVAKELLILGQALKAFAGEK